MERVKTGIEGLDQLLFGGFLPGSSVLVAGSPGTGKTSLGMQFLYKGITLYDEPGFFITFEEFPEQIYRDALNFGWDFRRLEEEDKLKVLFTSPDLMHQDIQRQEGLLPEMMREIHARRVVVDSISHFQALAPNPAEFRETIYGLINALKREGMTSMLIREIVETEAPGAGSEEYIADTVIRLTRERVEDQSMRFLEIVKSRGTRHVSVPNLFFIGDEGIRLVPAYREAFFTFEEAASTGLPQLDDLIGGGVPYGAFYLIELDAVLHQRLFDAAFLHEALLANDVYVCIGCRQVEEFSDTAQAAGFGPLFEEGRKAGRIHVLAANPTAVAENFEAIYRGVTGQQRVRLHLDLSRGLTLADRPQFFRFFDDLLEVNRRHRGVALGVVNPQSLDPTSVEKIRTATDGIVNVWRKGNYNYIQVLKTVNSVRSPVSTFLERPEPPFIEILSG
jgi:circadian clock protein KaiC